MDVAVNFNLNLAQTIPQLKNLLDEGRQLLAHLKKEPSPTYAKIIEPLALFQDRLSRFWAPVSHLNAVKNTPELRIVYEEGIAELTLYHVELGQDRDLYRCYEKIATAADFKTLTPAQQKVITYALRDFRLAGVALDDADQAQFKAIETELSELATTFEQHVMDATDAWSYHTESLEELQGLPEHLLRQAADKAVKKGLDGYVFGIDAPTYSVVMGYAQNRALRQRFYQAYVTRASELGEAQFDNSAIMVKMVNLKQQQAVLLGFKDYAHYSLANKMAPNVEAVMQFLQDLLVKSKPYAAAEIAALKDFARQHGLFESLEAYDLAYYSELQKQQLFGFSEESLRPYFPVSKVLKRLFALLREVFGLSLKEVPMEAWDPSVQFFEVWDETGSLRGGIYCDLYARPQKRSGAWMDECQGRLFKAGKTQYPVAFLTANFLAPHAAQEACLTHDDVITIYHEMGHVLQHVLTRVDEPDVAGINGVPWDAVELPSQFLENFAWTSEALQDLPHDLKAQLLQSRHFQAPLQMLRQLEFALFDFKLHQEKHLHSAADIQKILLKIREQTAGVPVPLYNRFAHSFGHIFAGGYAAGYYSYKWAEVLACDAYSRFEETGISKEELGFLFRETIFALGGSVDAMEVFIQFRGRPPTVEALLKSAGMNKE